MKPDCLATDICAKSLARLAFRQSGDWPSAKSSHRRNLGACSPKPKERVADRAATVGVAACCESAAYGVPGEAMSNNHANNIQHSKTECEYK